MRDPPSESCVVAVKTNAAVSEKELVACQLSHSRFSFEFDVLEKNSRRFQVFLAAVILKEKGLKDGRGFRLDRGDRERGHRVRRPSDVERNSSKSENFVLDY